MASPAGQSQARVTSPRPYSSASQAVPCLCGPAFRTLQQRGPGVSVAGEQIGEQEREEEGRREGRASTWSHRKRNRETNRQTLDDETPRAPV